LRWAAILVSEQTRQFFAWRDIADRFLLHVFGAYRVGLEEHLPLALLNDWDISEEGLAPYRVLILPNAAALSDQQLSAIREWVQSGGGLIATTETSLCDELGRPRADFGLADLFGVSFHGPVAATTDPTPRAELDVNFARALNDDYWRQRTGVAQVTWSDHPLWQSSALQSLTPSRSAVFKGPQVRVSEPDSASEVLIRFQPTGPDGRATANSRLPGLIVRNFGQGRVAYFAMALEAAQFSYAWPYQRHLLRAVIDHVAARPPVISLQAPRCVHMLPRVRTGADGARQLVVHLFNNVNTTADSGAPATDVPLREETIPIHGIRLTFHGRVPSRLHLEPGGTPLPLQSDEFGFAETLLPPLELHVMVVGEDWPPDDE
jgi:hypothetical protein